MERDSWGRTKATTPWWAGVWATRVNCSRRFLTDTDAGLAALSHQLLEAGIVALLSYQNMVKAAASGLEGFLHRMQAVQNFHEG